MVLKKTYCYLAYKKNKVVFSAIILFFTVALFSTFTEFRMSPFLAWDMYSRPMKRPESYVFYSIIYNEGKKYNLPQPWNHHKRMMLHYTLKWYDEAASNNYRDPHTIIGKHFLHKINRANEKTIRKLYNPPEEIKSYPIWFKQYLGRNLGIEIDSVSVYKIEVNYDSLGRIKENNKQLLFKQH